jgi:choline dehydrogenase-like flavoprotein
MMRQGSISDISSPPDDCTGQALLDHIDRGVSIYYHPSSTCRMGPEQDALAVVDEVGAVRGLDGLFVCDASIFPTVMRSNTNLPTVALAEHMAPILGNWKKD